MSNSFAGHVFGTVVNLDTFLELLVDNLMLLPI